jgi:hypothetical protein
MAVLAARFTDWTSFSGVGCAFSEADRSIAPEQAETTANTCGIREASVKQHNAFDAAAIGGKRSGHQIDPANPEGETSLRHGTGSPRNGSAGSELQSISCLTGTTQ